MLLAIKKALYCFALLGKSRFVLYVSALQENGTSFYRNAGDCVDYFEKVARKPHHETYRETKQHHRFLVSDDAEYELTVKYEHISQGQWYLGQLASFTAETNVGNYKEIEEETEMYKDGPVMTENRHKFWENYLKVDDWKNSDIFTTGPEGRPVLANFKYIILPIWWSDEDENNPEKIMDLSTIEDIMDKNYDYYEEMSFDSIQVTYQILDQTKFSISSENPDFGDTEAAARAFLDTTDYSYDGIILVYHTAQDGPFQGGGGWGNVNAYEVPFTWMSYRLDFSVTRHEIGHNFGHPHHISMRGYRECRGECGLYDGFDMMSGGNGYDISHFHVASKWFFNWVPDSLILFMQPEGSTVYCRKCVDSISNFKLKAFDKYLSPPQENDIFGVHIPVFGLGDNKMYSYWLQYRSGNDGDAAIGLSVHISWLYLGGIFGASYDQHNYDAHGDTISTFDSFVLPGTCYVIEPALVLMSIDPFSSEQVVPKVCVESLNEGSDITISVEFLDPSIVALKNTEFTADDEGFCNFNNYTLDTQISSSSNYLFQMKGTGIDGEVTVGLCPDTTNDVTAYFYDRYPYAPLQLNAPYAYGSYDSFKANADSCRNILSGVNQPITNAVAWRIITPNSKTSSGWALDITKLGFYSDARCNERSKVIPDGSAIDSGNAGGGWLPENAFGSGAWGGRTDINGDFWIGMLFDKVKSVKCIELVQPSSIHYSIEWTVQAKIEDTWQEVWVEKDMAQTIDPIQISWVQPEGYKTHTSASELGNTWILFAPAIDSQTINITLECSMTECRDGEVEEDGECIWRGPDQSITNAIAWRILTDKSKTNSGWALDISELDFYSEATCDENSKVISNGSAIDSGNAGGGWSPENAFDESGSWGGRTDDKGKFWLGMVFDEMTTIKCMELIQPSSYHYATEWTVQAEIRGNWQTVWVEKDIVQPNDPIQISWVITSDSPSFAPSSEISLVITSDSPSFAPSSETSLVITSDSPSFAPSSEISLVITSDSPSFAPSSAPCEGLSKRKCNKTDNCAYSRKKKLKYCHPKEGQEYDCSSIRQESECEDKPSCKYTSGTCVHKCDEETSKKKCKKVTKGNSNKKICSFKKETNPCYECQPITCSSN